MVDKAREVPCIPSITQGLSNLCHHRSQSLNAAPRKKSGRSRYGDIIKRANRARMPSKFVSLRAGKRDISPSPIRRTSPVRSPCLLPRLSFGEKLPNADELFSSAGGSSDPVSLPFGQYDRTMNKRSWRVKGEHHEEPAPQRSVECPRVDTNSPKLAQSSLNHTRNTTFLETCIREMMANNERRPSRGRSRIAFDDGRTRSSYLPTEGPYSGYALSESSRQPTGNAATPVVPPSYPDAKHLRSKECLDSTDIEAIASQRESTLCPLELEICRDSGAYVPGRKPTQLSAPSQQGDARAVLATCSKPPENGTMKEVDLPVHGQSAILCSPPSRIHSQTASHNPLARFPQSLRTSKPSRCRPKAVSGPQTSQTSGSGIAAAASPSLSRGNSLSIPDGPSSSSKNQATSSSSPPSVSPRNLATGGET